MSQLINPSQGDAVLSMPNLLKIVNTIADFGVSTMVIDATEMAFLELFNSDTYIDSSREFRSDILFQYKLLMDTLRSIQEVERVQFSKN